MPYKPYDFSKQKKNPQAELNSLMADMEKRANLANKNRYAHAAGAEFEKMIDRACEVYQADGKAMVVKVPENRRVIGRTGDRNSAMICVNAKKAHPDYMGSVAPNGQTIVFDAKHTGKDKILRNALTLTQAEILDAHMKCGAKCFVAVSFMFEYYFLIPYEWWRDMKHEFGRNYIRMTDRQIQPYRMPFDRDMGRGGEGYAWFLGRPHNISKLFEPDEKKIIDPETGEVIDMEAMVLV